MKSNLKALLFLLSLSFTVFSCKTTSILSSKDNPTAKAMSNALVWQEANPIFAKAPTDWTNGAYYTCLVKAHQATKDNVYYDAMLNMGIRNKWQTYERLFHADDVVISNAYLYLNQLGEKQVDLTATDKFIQTHLFEPNDWKAGKAADKPILWWWCDALFMAPPLLTKYAVMKNDMKYLDEMHKYYMESYDLLYDKEENLFYRDNRFLITGAATDRREPNGNKIFWSRGNGWVLAGLALMLEDMPKNYKHRPFYEDLFKKMSAKVLKLQPADGLWRTSLLSPETFPHGEVSGSGFYTYALAWGINNGYLDKKTYAPAVTKAWTALAACQQESGKVGWVQNIGYDPKPADKDSWQNFGSGAFILAGSEMLKLK